MAPGIFRFLADCWEVGAAVTAPTSPHSSQRSGRIPALPYPLHERLGV
jgi:hypothetical protein